MPLLMYTALSLEQHGELVVEAGHGEGDGARPARIVIVMISRNKCLSVLLVVLVVCH